MDEITRRLFGTDVDKEWPTLTQAARDFVVSLQVKMHEHAVARDSIEFDVARIRDALTSRKEAMQDLSKQWADSWHIDDNELIDRLELAAKFLVEHEGDIGMPMLLRRAAAVIKTGADALDSCVEMKAGYAAQVEALKTRLEAAVVVTPDRVEIAANTYLRVMKLGGSPTEKLRAAMRAAMTEALGKPLPRLPNVNDVPTREES